MILIMLCAVPVAAFFASFGWYMGTAIATSLWVWFRKSKLDKAER